MNPEAAPKTGHDPLDRLVAASEDIRAARSLYLAEQEAAWQRYVAAVDHALTEDLGLDGQAGEPAGDDLAQELLDNLRGRIDDLRLRAHLGRMELEDLATELRHAAAKVTDSLRR